MNEAKNNEDVGAEITGMLSNTPIDGTEKEEQTDEETVSDETAAEGKEAEEEAAEEEVSEKAEGDVGSEEGEIEEGEEETTDDEEEPEGEEGKEPSELETLKQQNEELRKQLDAVLTPEEVEEDAATAEEEPQIEELPPEAFIDTDEAFETALNSREKFNEVLDKVASKSHTGAVEHMLKRMPILVSRMVQSEMNNHIASEDFYKANPELKPQKKFVAFVYAEMLKKDPKAKPHEVLQKLAKEVHTRLGTGKQGKGKGKHRREKEKSNFAPAGGGGSHRRNKPSAPKGIGAQITEMENLG